MIHNQQPAPVPVPATRTLGKTMRATEKVYTAFALIMCGFLIVSVATFVFYLIPILEDESANMFRLISFVQGLYAAVLGLTALINLKTRELNVVSTILQIVVLFLTGYGFPFAIWGIVLLVRKNGTAHPSIGERK